MKEEVMNWHDRAALAIIRAIFEMYGHKLTVSQIEKELRVFADRGLIKVALRNALPIQK
jgi:hypothetical protein